MELTPAEIERYHADMEQIRATTMKLNAETQKIIAEAKWYPFVVAVGMFGAAVGFVKLFM